MHKLCATKRICLSILVMLLTLTLISCSSGSDSTDDATDANQQSQSDDNSPPGDNSTDNNTDNSSDNDDSTDDSNSGDNSDGGDNDSNDGDNPNNPDNPDNPNPPLADIVLITSPESLTTVGSSPLKVTGRVDPTVRSLTLNGVPLNPSSGQFSANVTLEEGQNTIIARAIDANGASATSSIYTSLDLTPPYITIDSHTDGETVHTKTVNIAGLVNDIVRGTIEASQAEYRKNKTLSQCINLSILRL